MRLAPDTAAVRRHDTARVARRGRFSKMKKLIVEAVADRLDRPLLMYLQDEI